MPTEYDCPGCGKRLRVADEHAGRQARCPHCGAISGGAAESTPREPASQPTSGEWKMKTSTGRVYTAASRSELDQWAAQGRIPPDAQVSQDGQHWLGVKDVYSFGAAPEPAATQRGGFQHAAFVEPHRAGFVLTIAVLGFFCFCPLFGLGACLLGWSDLQAMRQGRMDAAGRPMTRAGVVIAVIQTVLSGLLWCGFAAWAFAIRVNF